MLRFILKVSLYLLISVIALPVIYIVISFTFSLIEIKPVKQPEDVSIYILTNGVHTELVLPIKFDTTDWSKRVKFSHIKSRDTTYHFIAFGWGDKNFFIETPTWADLKFSTAFNAVFGLGEAAIHTTFYKNISASNNCIEVRLSIENYRKLVNYIYYSFESTQHGEFFNIKTNYSYGDNDAFYEAVGRYSLFYTCNTWTNNGLKVCGLKACLWTPFDKGIFYHYRN